MKKMPILALFVISLFSCKKDIQQGTFNGNVNLRIEKSGEIYINSTDRVLSALLTGDELPSLVDIYLEIRTDGMDGPIVYSQASTNVSKNTNQTYTMPSFYLPYGDYYLTRFEIKKAGEEVFVYKAVAANDPFNLDSYLEDAELLPQFFTVNAENGNNVLVHVIENSDLEDSNSIGSGGVIYVSTSTVYPFYFYTTDELSGATSDVYSIEVIAKTESEQIDVSPTNFNSGNMEVVYGINLPKRNADGEEYIEYEITIDPEENNVHRNTYVFDINKEVLVNHNSFETAKRLDISAGQMPTVTVSVTNEEVEEGGNIEFKFALQEVLTEDITIQIAANLYDDVVGSTPQKVTVYSGSTSTTFAWQVEDDTLGESAENIEFVMTSEQEVILNPKNVSVVITESDGGSPVRINEFHYDNDGVDVNEFAEIKIVGSLPQNWENYTLFRYNDNGLITGSKNLGEMTYSQHGSDHYLVWETTLNNGPDGLLLTDDLGNAIEFISYEGTFEGHEGIANGMFSVEITDSNGDVISQKSTTIGISLSKVNGAWVLQNATAGQPN